MKIQLAEAPHWNSTDLERRWARRSPCCMVSFCLFFFDEMFFYLIGISMIFTGLSMRQDWRRVFEELYRHEQIQIFDVHRCFLVCLRLSICRDDFCWVDTRTVSNSGEFKSFLLSKRLAPESTPNSLSSGFMLDGIGGHQTSEGEKIVAPFSSKSPLSLYTFRQFHPLRAHRSFAKVSSCVRSSNFGAGKCRS